MKFHRRVGKLTPTNKEKELWREEELSTDDAGEETQLLNRGTSAVTDKERENEKRRVGPRKTSTSLSVLSSCPSHSFPSISSLCDSPLICHSPYLLPNAPPTSSHPPSLLRIIIVNLLSLAASFIHFLTSRHAFVLHLSGSGLIHHLALRLIISLLYLPLWSEILSLPRRIYGQFISLGGLFHFPYDSCPSHSVMQAIPAAS